MLREQIEYNEFCRRRQKQQDRKARYGAKMSPADCKALNCWVRRAVLPALTHQPIF